MDRSLAQRGGAGAGSGSGAVLSSEPEEVLSSSLGRGFRSVRKQERPSPSSSPRSPNTRPLVFHGRRPNDVPVVRASGTPHGTRPESKRAGKVGRGPGRRSRGPSETENPNNAMQCLTSDHIWFDKHRYDEAECRFYAGVNGASTAPQTSPKPSYQVKGRPQKRPHRNSSSHADQELQSRMKTLELENQRLHNDVELLRAALLKLDSRVVSLEKGPVLKAAAAVTAAPVENGDDDDDIDLFGSDEEDEEAERLKQERLDAYAAKKAKKPALIAKSSILLDVKPWDDETDMASLEACVRSVQMDGLLWGASKLVAVGYGIKKLQINCVVEDEKVGTDILEEEITKFEDLVQSVDVAAFNKI